MSTVKRVEQIARRGGVVHTINDTETVTVAAKAMHEHRIGCLVVLNSEQCVVGILTERDIVNKVVAHGIDPMTLCVSAVMTPKVLACTMRPPLEKAERMMTTHAMRHLPIIEDGVPVGMISSRDIIAHQLSNARTLVCKQAHVLEEIELQHPGITSLTVDARGRIVI